MLAIEMAIFWTLVLRTQPALSCSKFTIEMLDQGVKYVQSQQYRHHKDASCSFGVCSVNIEHVSHVVLVFLLLTLNM